ncbi:cupin domain-containing protein [bacterium]|nr:MAG: cupin domain-containing protein [bacterium]
MKIIERQEAGFREKPEGDKTYYYLFDDYEVMMTEQPPHSEQAWHHHEIIWETIYIVEGELRVLWREGDEEKSRMVYAGDLLETEQSSHTFRNESASVVKLMAIKHIRSDQNYHEVFKSDKVLD